MTRAKRQVDEPKVYSEMPADLQAEMSLLGTLMIGSTKTGEVMESLAQDEFYDTKHQALYGVMRSMWNRNIPMEWALLIGELDARELTETAGGIAYISNMIGGQYLSQNLMKYRDRVKSRKVLRDLVWLGELTKDAAIEAHRSGADVSEVIDEALSKLATIGRDIGTEHRGKTSLDASIAMVASMEVSGSQVRVYFDLPELDECTGGARAGELWVLTADTGVGKSFGALQIKRRACADGHHILYASGEMLAEHLMGRVVASAADVSYGKIRRPELLTSQERLALMEAAGRQCKTCRILDGELTLPHIKAAARAMASNKELGGIIVDYDELVDVKGKDEWDQQRILVRSLKTTAMELAVPCFVVSQLRKSTDQIDSRKPTLQRLYGSGAKAKHASVVLHIDRPYVRNLKGNESEAHIFILKSRDGRIGKVDCDFNLRTFRFVPKTVKESQENE